MTSPDADSLTDLETRFPNYNCLTPHEQVSPERLESVRILDAQQSLASPLYREKAEKMGLEEYFKQYSTTRVR